ncbi:MAG: glutamine-hydrolyzing GMP synthase [Candidatus Thorarchaeota archaeon]
MTITEKILVVDYGGQYTHLISRRCRELGVYSEIISQDTKLDDTTLQGVRGIILSGGPRVVDESDLSSPFQENTSILKERKIPVLGICFGHQLLAVANGANLEGGGNPEYGNTDIVVSKDSSILNGLDKEQTVWMSHSDQVIGLPEILVPIATSGDGHIAAFRSKDNLIFGVQFHPEVTHTPHGLSILKAFLREACTYKEHWTPESQIDDITSWIKKEVGDGRVLMGTSGGVDSTVAAYLIKRAIGNRFHCVFVDNGLLRAGEKEEVVKAFAEMGFDNFIAVDAADEFLTGLEGIEDPEEKRKIIAETFIRVFERTAKELGHFEFLGQGTIYPDRVESAATGLNTAVIKSHHNVRLPDWMKLKVVEPLRDLYKDEVRKAGLSLGIPKHMIHRQPFPGPSLAIRIAGPVTREQLVILRHAETILQEELVHDPNYASIWQSFCVLLPVRTVGVMGDERTYDQAVVIRAIESTDAMTASVCQLEWSVLLKAGSRIANEVQGINRVVYDVTSKPPGTIEWY